MKKSWAMQKIFSLFAISFFLFALDMQANAQQTNAPQSLADQFKWEMFTTGGLYTTQLRAVDNQGKPIINFYCHPDTKSKIHVVLFNNLPMPLPKAPVDVAIIANGKRANNTAYENNDTLFFTVSPFDALIKNLLDGNTQMTLLIGNQIKFDLPSISGVKSGLLEGCLDESEYPKLQDEWAKLDGQVAQNPTPTQTQPSEPKKPSVKPNTPSNTGGGGNSDPNVNIPSDPNALAQLCQTVFKKPGSKFALACELIAGIALNKPNNNQPQGQAKTIEYKCINDATFAVRYDNQNGSERAVLLMQGINEVPLPKVSSANGSKYNDGQIDWHLRGYQGILSQNGQTLRCNQL